LSSKHSLGPGSCPENGPRRCGRRHAAAPWAASLDYMSPRVESNWKKFLGCNLGPWEAKCGAPDASVACGGFGMAVFLRQRLATLHASKASTIIVGPSMLPVGNGPWATASIVGSSCSVCVDPETGRVWHVPCGWYGYSLHMHTGTRM
jgi:hypothetical protein